MALTAKQHRFVEEYLIDLNGTQAAIRAGYSRQTARFQASDLLTKHNIQMAVQEAMGERAIRTRTDADWVLERLRAEAEADLADIYDDQGALLPIAEWPLVWRTGLMVAVETEEIKSVGDDGVKTVSVVRRVKQSDRIKRLELIGRHVGVQAFKDKVEVDGMAGLADRIARAKLRGRTS